MKTPASIARSGCVLGSGHGGRGWESTKSWSMIQKRATARAAAAAVADGGESGEAAGVAEGGGCRGDWGGGEAG